MSFCSNCGAQLPEGANACPSCGTLQNNSNNQHNSNNQYQQNNQQYNSQQYNQGGAPEDKGGFGWSLLGFCIPLVGLILYLVWKDNKPITAKAAGKGALISVIISVGFYVLSLLLGLGTAFMM